MTEWNKAPAACLIGWPAAHSRSPLIHHYWLRTLGIEGGYVIEAVPPDEFQDFVLRLSLRGFVGANVTIPHKERALALSEPDDRARAVGAANTLWLSGRRTALDQYRRRGFHQQSRCLRARLGQGRRMRWCSAPAAQRARGACSGWSSAASSACISSTAPWSARARSPINSARAFMPAAWEAIAGSAAARRTAGEHDLARHARPARARTSTSACCRSNAVVADLVYVPLQTPLLAAARARGLKTADGLGMLLHQAVRGFELWFGQRPEVTSELRALVEADLTMMEAVRPGMSGIRCGAGVNG